MTITGILKIVVVVGWLLVVGVGVGVVNDHVYTTQYTYNNTVNNQLDFTDIFSQITIKSLL